MIPRIEWPEGKRIAFTVFDDPDGDTVAARKWLYPFLADLGFRTSIAVWPIGPLRERNSDGETCADAEYREHLQRMQKLGFEISFHNAAPHSATRDEIIHSLEVFREYFGEYPQSVANHYNADALYFGAARLHSPFRRALYHIMTRGGKLNRFSGHIEGSPYFWGDVCYERTRYFRNFVYSDINTLKACPYQPYHSPERPYVRQWFSASEGTDCRAFVKTISEANQDRLEEEGGMSIMYSHFGKGFVSGGKLDPEFSRLMTRISRKNAWFAPTSKILDYLNVQKGTHVVSRAEIARLEWKWLAHKAFYGTT
jgi:hypothetical protein